jgi:molybdate transport system substrate-binding protein
MRRRSRGRIRWGVALACALMFGSAAPAKDEAVLRVGAATSLREAAEKIGKRFTETSGTRVELTFGASSELAAQLRAGAPIDLLMSADEDIPHALEREGIGWHSRPFAANRLVVVARAELAPKIQKSSDLVSEAVKHVALPAPVVPAGHYAREWLARKGLLKVVEMRAVQTENVRATLAAVDAGNADAAIVYATDARVATSAKVAFEIPANEQPRIVYVAIESKASKNLAIKDFMEFLVGDDGQRLLKGAGFLAPEDAPTP